MTGGWELTGELDWVTSWTIADVIAIVAEVDDGRLVRVVVEPKRRDGLLADVPLELAAMGGTHTCPVQVRRLQVPDIDVISVIDKVRWSELDSFGTRNAGAHMFGVTRAAIALLQQTGEQRDHEPSLELAAALVDRVRTIRREAYSLIDDAEPGDYTEDRVRLRAQALDLAIKATTAAVAARAGAAIRLTDPAQRFAREALFYLVQAQTLETRTASLTELQRSLQQH
jgi:alkylation response protein AidB-like acyl-CoA dehydrogenase